MNLTLHNPHCSIKIVSIWAFLTQLDTVIDSFMQGILFCIKNVYAVCIYYGIMPICLNANKQRKPPHFLCLK